MLRCFRVIFLCNNNWSELGFTYSHMADIHLISTNEFLQSSLILFDRFRMCTHSPCAPTCHNLKTIPHITYHFVAGSYKSSKGSWWDWLVWVGYVCVCLVGSHNFRWFYSFLTRRQPPLPTSFVFFSLCFSSLLALCTQTVNATREMHGFSDHRRTLNVFVIYFMFHLPCFKGTACLLLDGLFTLRVYSFEFQMDNGCLPHFATKSESQFDKYVRCARRHRVGALYGAAAIATTMPMKTMMGMRARARQQRRRSRKKMAKDYIINCEIDLMLLPLFSFCSRITWNTYSLT